jgi:hypothetical protein
LKAQFLKFLHGQEAIREFNTRGGGIVRRERPVRGDMNEARLRELREDASPRSLIIEKDPCVWQCVRYIARLCRDFGGIAIG